MDKDKENADQLTIEEVGDLLEMEMEEYDPLHDRYTEVSVKMDNLMKNLVLSRITNKRNELNLLFLFQKINNKAVDNDSFEKIFNDLDSIFTEINHKNLSYDELITKNNDLGKRINPMIRDLLVGKQP